MPRELHAHGGRTRTRPPAIRQIASCLLALSGLLASLLLAPGIAQAHLQFARAFGSTEVAAPRGVAVDQRTLAATANDVYVADAANHRVDQFDQTGVFIRTWGWGVADGASEFEVCTTGCRPGLQGSEAGQFSEEGAIAVDSSTGTSQGDIYVADSGAQRVEKFSPGGEYISQLTGSAPGSTFESVSGIAVDGNGDLWVLDSEADMVYEFDGSGNLLSHFGEYYAQTKEIAVDSAGDIYLLRGDGETERWTPASRAGGRPEVVDTGDGSAITVDESTNDLFVEHIAGPILQYDASGRLLARIEVGRFGNGEGLAFNPNASSPEAGGAGVLYASDASDYDVGIFLAPSSPQVDTELANGVTSASAILRATVDPGGHVSRYRFEYGTTSSYGAHVPTRDAEIGSTRGDQALVASATGLLPDTTYHYRVVVSDSQGEVDGPDQSFHTYPAGSANALPDGRVYEQVSPQDKSGGDVGGPGFEGILASAAGQSSLSGDGIAYESLTSFGDAANGKLVTQYVATRTADGWSTHAPMPAESGPDGQSNSGSYRGFSNDLSTGVLLWGPGSLAPGSPAGFENLYLQGSDGSYRVLTSVTPPDRAPGSYGLNFAGASADFSHVLFEANDTLAPGAPADERSLYEWTSSGVRLVSILPDGDGAVNAGAGDGIFEDFTNDISSDGSRIFWTDGEGQLYVRENATMTVKINASQRSESAGDGTARYMDAAPDGSKVYFTDETGLTDQPGDGGGDLYEYDLTDGKLEDLSPNGGQYAGVEGVLGTSSDGSYVYFVATAALLEEATEGARNLYVDHNGTLEYIGAMTSADSHDWTQTSQDRTARVTADGEHLAFLSAGRLTSYDNTDAVTEEPDTELYMYDAHTKQLSCPSCNPSGVRPVGSASVPGGYSPNYLARFLSEDGSRVFFNSEDALLPGDVNGRRDVYEYENGRLYLLSTGTSNDISTFVDASADGDDAFFTTRSELVPGDRDASADLYDARVDGGFPEAPTPVACAGENCLGPVSAPPVSSAAATVLPGEAAASPAPAAPESKPKPKPKKAKPKPESKGKRKAKPKSESQGKRKAHAKRRAKSKSRARSKSKGKSKSSARSKAQSKVKARRRVAATRSGSHR